MDTISLQSGDSNEPNQPENDQTNGWNLSNDPQEQPRNLLEQESLNNKRKIGSQIKERMINNFAFIMKHSATSDTLSKIMDLLYKDICDKYCTEHKTSSFEQIILSSLVNQYNDSQNIQDKSKSFLALQCQYFNFNKNKYKTDQFTVVSLEKIVAQSNSLIDQISQFQENYFNYSLANPDLKISNQINANNSNKPSSSITRRNLISSRDANNFVDYSPSRMASEDIQEFQLSKRMLDGLFYIEKKPENCLATVLIHQHQEKQSVYSTPLNRTMSQLSIAVVQYTITEGQDDAIVFQ